MTTTQGQSLWQALFFIAALMAIGLAIPLLGFFIFVTLIMAGLWTLRQPKRTPADVFAARTAILLPSVMLVIVVSLIAVSANGYTEYTVASSSWQGDVLGLGIGSTQPYFAPEITPENTAAPSEIQIDLTVTPLK